MAFGSPHPELSPGECFVGNTCPHDAHLYMWKSKRLGKTAYDINNAPIRDMVPIFALRSELMAAGVDPDTHPGLPSLMRLDRFVEMIGKFSIILNRKGGRIVHNGDPVNDFFVVLLKDVDSEDVLLFLAAKAEVRGDLEYAADLRRLAATAGPHHPHCKVPD